MTALLVVLLFAGFLLIDILVRAGARRLLELRLHERGRDGHHEPQRRVAPQGRILDREGIVHEAGDDRPLHRRVEVGVLEHDERRLAAQLEVQALHGG